MKQSAGKYLLYVAIAVVALIATSAVIHSILPPMIPKGVAAKLKFFAEHKDEFDTLIVGTSRIYYSISPEIFDATTREEGVETHTFNFGIDAMHPPENLYVLEQILKTKPRRLKAVLLELGPVQPKWFDVLGTQRAVYWHDWPRTRLTLERLFTPRGHVNPIIRVLRLWRSRQNLAWTLTQFGNWFANVSRAADLLPASERDRFADAASELGPKGDGYRVAGEAMSAERAAGFLKRLAVERSHPLERDVDPGTERGYRKAAAQIRAAGAVPIFVVTPELAQARLRFTRGPAPASVIAFNDVSKYPRFYDPKMRIDDAHLTREGAEEFTRLLAHEVVPQLREP